MSIDFDPTIDHYKVLGVDPKASAEDIKKAYRKLAKANHPDSTGGDKAKESRFKQVSAAYDVLGDAKKRGQYDQIRASGFRPGAGFPGGGGAGFPGGFGSGAGFPSGFSGGATFDIGDLFAQMFSGGARPGASRVRVEHGGGGDGYRTRAEPGRRRGPPANGEVELESKVQASDGTWLAVRDADVHSDLRIPFDRAILGTVAEVTTVDGRASVKVPPGTSSGRKLRLKGKGVVGSTGKVGDHYVTVHLDVPKDLDDEARKLLVQFVQRTRK